MNELQTMQRSTVSMSATLVFTLSVCLISSASSAAPIFVETFDNGNLPPAGQSPSPQFGTGLDLYSFGDILGWTEAGHATVHVVDRDTGSGTDFAVMIWSGDPTFPSGSPNVITLDNGIAANSLGTVYRVTFEVGPTVFQISAQVTTATDSLLLEVLRSDSSVLASYNSFPGAWAGSQTFATDEFTYVGDGAGDVTLRISSTNPLNTIFAGAIDNLQVDAVPEPSSLALLATGAVGLIAYRRRKRKFAA